MDSLKTLSKYRNYWLHNLRYEQLTQFSFSKFAHVIVPKEEYEAGNIALDTVSSFINNTKEHDIICIAPIVAINKKNGEFYIPVSLAITLDEHGNIAPDHKLSFPFVPQYVTEPHLQASVCLGLTDSFDNYFSINPPKWVSQPNLLTWKNQLAYAEQMLVDVTNGIWKWHLYDLHFEFVNYGIMFVICANTAFTWQQKILNQIDSNLITSKKIPEPHISCIDKNIRISKEQRAIVNKVLASSENYYCHTFKGTGKSFIARNLIAAYWIQAAIDESYPINIAWINGKQLPKYASIFECDPEISCISKEHKQQLQTNNFISLDIIRSFLENFSIVHKCKVENLAKAKDMMHSILLENKQYYVTLMQNISLWKDLASKVELQYQSKGGLDTRIKQLQANLKEHLLQHKHLEVIYSLWRRLVSSLPLWIKCMKFTPWLQRRSKAFAKLYSFFNKHFPAENVKGLCLADLEFAIDDIIKKSKKKETVIIDSLMQAQSEAKQLDIIKNKAIHQFCNKFNISVQHIKNHENIEDYLDEYLRYPMFIAALHYWEATYLQQIDWTTGQQLQKYLTGELSDKIDLLIVEHSELVSPMLAGALFSISAQVIIFGSPYKISNNFIANQIDYYTLLQLDLISDEHEFESLQQQGVLASQGSMWDMVKQSSIFQHGYLTQQWDARQALLSAQKTLMQDACNIQSMRKEAKYLYPGISIVELTDTYSEMFFGSMINTLESENIIQWLLQNRQQILAYYQANTLKDILSIHTTFSAQATQLRKMLLEKGLPDVSVSLLQLPCLVRKPIAIFSPVYTHKDQGPFIFDKGVEILGNLLANTTDSIIIIGDSKLFNKQLHSASGKFAKHLISHQKSNIEQTATEVI